MTHNTMYERLVDQSDNKVQGFIAYGLYKTAKREWVRGFEADHGRPPRTPEVAAYVSTYTPQTVNAFEAQARGVLAQFAEGIIADARPEMVEAALRGDFWKNVFQSMAANAIYTVALLVLAVVLTAAGIDILGIFETVHRQAG